ncbi:MAG: twin-arginine translocation signal domain-containing protein [Gemmatimonadaceae bacterium]
MPSRREFLQRTTATTAALGALGALAVPFPALASVGLGPEPALTSADWDVSWPARITGKHKAVYDVAEVESGYGVWRASAWAAQYADVFKIPAKDITPVIVLRHNAIILAMQQPFWDKYSIGTSKNVTHPLTGEPTDRNPVLLDETSGVPAPFNQAGLHRQLSRGVVVLACNLALQDCVELIKQKGGLSDEAAHKEAVANLVPGVILQPSGVFAAVRAQEAGCAYVRSS